MLHVITFYSVAAEAAGPFVRSIRMGGEWNILARTVAPALIATDLLEHQSFLLPPFFPRSSILFVSLDFWSSTEAYRCACQQPACQALLLARRRLAKCAFELGEFCFPASIEIKSQLPPAVVRG